MRERLHYRYSACFKREVVEALEAGRFESLDAARRHYGIGGSTTVKAWLRRFGKQHLQAKVIRVEKPDEADQMRDLRKRIAELERALGQTQAARVLEEEYLKRACARLGEEVEGFKKKSAGGVCIPPSSGG